MQIFGWRILLNRIPTKDLLSKLGILSDIEDLLCVFYLTELENISHLLGSCPCIGRIWRKVFDWVGAKEELSFELFVGFFNSYEKVKSGDHRTIIASIWLASA